MARRRPVATARHDRRARRSTTSTSRRSTGAIADDLSLPHVWDIVAGVRRPGPARRRAARARPARRRRSSPSARRSPGSRSGRSSASALGDRVRPLAAGRAGVRAVRRRLARPSRSSPSRRSSSSRSRPTGCRSWSIATYLTFFPVTIASLRGLRAFDPRALELFRSYAASRRQILCKLRLPTSVPYLFTGAPDRGGRVASSARSSASRPARHRRRPRQRDHQLQPVLHRRARAPVGDDRHVHVARPRASSASSDSRERLRRRRGRYRPVERTRDRRPTRSTAPRTPPTGRRAGRSSRLAGVGKVVRRAATSAVDGARAGST